MMPEKKLLLVGWDAADWKVIRPLIEKGEMPNLARLLKKGVSGNLATLQPVLSPMLWTSIATGKHAYQHGVSGFTEVDPESQKVVPISAATRQCRALWEMLSTQGLKSHVVGWFATQGERDPNVHLVSNLYPHAPKREISDPEDWPAPPPGTYFPENLNETLDAFRIHPTELDDEILRLFVPRAHEIDQKTDRRLYQLAEHLAEAFSIQAAATWLVEHRPWNLTAVYFRAIDEICHHFMPFHPPQMEGVESKAFELYQDVVNSAYRLHDLMLGRLVALAGADAAVMLISDHGFHSDHLRPRALPNVPAGIMEWHRSQGVFAAAGPGLGQGTTLEGARLLDITPTILNWFGLPRGSDMEGRVLHSVFADARPEKEIPSWEKLEGIPPPNRQRLPAEANALLLDQFVALGYIDPLPAEANAAAIQTERENRWQMARACVHGGRLEEALPLFEEVFHAFPERPDHAFELARCQMRLGLLREAAETAEIALEQTRNPVGVRLMQAYIASEQGKLEEAASILEGLRAQLPNDLRLWGQLAYTLLRVRRWDACLEAAQHVLQIDPDQALAWVCQARCQLHQGKNKEALQSADAAIALQFENALAHFNRGLALIRLEQWEAAHEAFESATLLNPQLIPPFRFLAYTQRQLGRRNEAEDTMERARLMRSLHNFQKAETVAHLQDTVRQRAHERKKARAATRAKQAGERPSAPNQQVHEIVIVSGLPRSGTSLMMQMLAAGGLPPMTDGERVADRNNPEGYYEWEAIKQLPQKPHLIDQSVGKAVKVVSPLLNALPPKNRYKILFMRRPMEEVIRSQQRMIAERGLTPQSDVAALEQQQTRHLESILATIRRHPRCELLEVDYPSLIQNPLEAARSIIEFLGPKYLPMQDPEALASVIKPELYRSRRTLEKS